MKNKLTHNLGLKLISLLLAITIWLIIIYTYDPADTADFTLDVTILNEEAITSLNKVYEVIEGDTVTIRVKGNTSQVNSLRSSDFKATADISKLSPTLHANIDVVCTKTNDVEISFLGKINMLAIQLEDVAEKQFKVSVIQRGTPAEGYFVSDSKTKPNLIQVRGAESAIKRISQVCVPVDVSGVTETFRSEAEPKAYDADGNEIKTGSLTFSKNPVAVSTTVYGTKEVPIEIVPLGDTYKGYRLVNAEYEPKSVIVAGDEDELAGLSSVQVEIAMNNRITNLEETLPLENYIPDNLYLTDQGASVNVFLEVERLKIKEFDVPYEMIQLRGTDLLAWDYALEKNGTFAVKVEGRKEDLDKLELVSLRPFVETAELTEEGEYTLTIKFELEDKYEVQTANTVVLHMTAKSMEGENPDDGEADIGEGESGVGNAGDAGDGGTGADSGNGTGSSEPDTGMDGADGAIRPDDGEGQ